MDKLNGHLNPRMQQQYHPTILAAMKLAHNKLSCYYSMTDLSSVYQIAMGKYLVIFYVWVLTIKLVLYPGLKLKYFQQKEWEEEWIDNVEELVHEVYVSHYEGKGDAVAPTPDLVTNPVSDWHTLHIMSDTNHATVGWQRRWLQSIWEHFCD